MLYQGDGTNTEIMDFKVHVSKVSQTQTILDSLDDAGAFDMDLLQRRTRSQRAVCDLQQILDGTGAEMYRILAKELSSAGVWCHESRAAENNPRRFSMLNMAVDKGPENVGCCKRVLQHIADCPMVSLTVVWCLFHQTDRIDRSVLCALDGWQWCSDHFKIKYFTAVKAVVRTWRGPGHKKKIIDRTRELFPGIAYLRIS